MKSEDIRERLAELFKEYRIIFWNDPEREFENILIKVVKFQIKT